MISQKIFTGKMNSDVSEYMLPSGDYLYAMNLRIGSSDGQDVGTVVNTKSNKIIPIPSALSSLFDTSSETIGIDTVGTCIAEDVRKVFWFVSRSDSRDFILEYDSPSESIFKILVNLDDTNGVDITKFSANFPIYSSNLIDGQYLKWTDFKGRPASVDINRFKSGVYGIIDDFHIRAAKAPSLNQPIVSYISDPTVTANRLKKKLFQVQYLFNYDGNERSVYSPMSQRPIPIDETTNDTDSTKNNGISITFNVGTNQVKSIDVTARYNLNDWFLINTFDRATITATDQFGNANDPGYNTTDNTYTFTFYNNGNYNNVDLNEQLLYFDYIPLKARTQEYAQGSMLYAGVVQGYDAVPVAGVVYPTYASSAYVAGTSVYNWKSNSKYGFGIIYFDQFGVSGTVNNIPGFNVNTKSFASARDTTRILMNWSITHTPPSWAVKYQWARTDNLTHQNFLFWTVRQVVSVVQNNKAYWDLTIDTIESYNRANQGSATTVDRAQRSTISYGFTAGDRVTIHRLDGSTWVSDYDTEVVDFEVYTAPVLPDTVSNTPLYRLRIAKKTTGSETIVGGGLIEIYTPKPPSPIGEDLNIYHEFGQIFDITNPGTDSAAHSVVSGTFNEGDVFYRERMIPTQAPNDDLTTVYTTVTEQLEDPGFSDFYISNYNSDGRPNLVDKNNKQIDLETTFLFSEVYEPDTQINGLSRVFQLSSEDYDRAFGPIQRIVLRGNQIEVFQRLNTGAIPLFANITETASGTPQLILSEKLLNRIRPYFGGYGIGDQPSSLVISDGLIFFTDPNRGEVLRLDGSGINSISKQAFMDNYFTSLLQEYARGNQAINGGFEKRFDEYILSFRNDNVTIFDFNDENDSEWDNSFTNTLNRSTLSIVSGPSIGSASMLSNGILRYQPTLTETGEAIIVYTGNDLLGHALGNRNLCINVTHPGISTIWVGTNPKCFTILGVTKKYYLNRQLYLGDGSSPYFCDGDTIIQENYNPADDSGSRANPDYVTEVTDDCFCLNECEDFSGNVNFINNTLYTIIVDEGTAGVYVLTPHDTHLILYNKSYHTIRSTNSGTSVITVWQYDCATVDPMTVTPRFTLPNTTFNGYCPVSNGDTVYLGFSGDTVPTC